MGNNPTRFGSHDDMDTSREAPELHKFKYIQIRIQPFAQWEEWANKMKRTPGGHPLEQECMSCGYYQGGDSMVYYKRKTNFTEKTALNIFISCGHI